MTDQAEIVIANRTAEKARALDMVERFGREHGCPPLRIHRLQLAVEEHLTNILAYAYEDGLPHEIIVRAHWQNGGIAIQIEDDGRAFNPLDQPPPDLTLPLDQRPIGGLGIHLIRRSVDAVEYRRQANRNVLSLKLNH
jgi:anti-sigma regulatory factor (Ser/Thr protein kinase)